MSREAQYKGFHLAYGSYAKVTDVFTIPGLPDEIFDVGEVSGVD